MCITKDLNEKNKNEFREIFRKIIVYNVRRVERAFVSNYNVYTSLTKHVIYPINKQRVDVTEKN